MLFNICDSISAPFAGLRSSAELLRAARAVRLLRLSVWICGSTRLLYPSHGLRPWIGDDLDPSHSLQTFWPVAARLRMSVLFCSPARPPLISLHALISVRRPAESALIVFAFRGFFASATSVSFYSNYSSFSYVPPPPLG